MSLLKKLSNLFVSSLEWFLIITVSLIQISVFTNVIARYVFSFYIRGILEFVRHNMLWITFIGGAYVCITEGHLGVKLVDELSNKFSAPIKFFTSILTLFVGVYLFISAYRISLRVGLSPTYTLGWPQGVIYSGIAIGAFFIVVLSAKQMITKIILFVQLIRRESNDGGGIT